MKRSRRVATATLDSGTVSTAVGAVGVLVLALASAPLSAQTPIHRDDVRVNATTGANFVNPRIIFLIDRNSVRPAGGAVAFSDWNTVAGNSTLTWQEFSDRFVFDGPDQPAVVTPQWENQVVDLMASPPDSLGNFNLSFAIEYAGLDSTDVGAILGADGSELRFDSASNYHVGIQSDPRLVETGFGSFGMAYATSLDPSSGIQRPSIAFGVGDFSSSDLGFPGMTVNRVNELANATVFAPSADFIALSFRGGAGGQFIVAWESFGSNGNDNSLSSIQARFVGVDGIPVGSQFQVNTAITNFQRRPDVAALSDGNIVIVWHSDESLGDDDSLTSIQARLYGNDGQPLGPEFQVNNQIMGNQYQASVAAMADGGFIVVWQDAPITTTNLSGRLFAAGGVPIADQFQVNTLQGISSDDPPSVAAAGNEFLAVWSRGGDIYMNGSFIQVFSNGFESSTP